MMNGTRISIRWHAGPMEGRDWGELDFGVGKKVITLFGNTSLWDVFFY